MQPDNFNRPAPPGFRGLQPDLPIRVYQRKRPHWRQDGATYFVTTRLADSISQEHVRALKRWRRIWEATHPEPRSEEQWQALAKEINGKTEAWLDSGYGECVFNDPSVAAMMSKGLLHYRDNVVCSVFCFVVMPNHIHVVMRPSGKVELEGILKSTKGFVARRINEMLGRTGPLWAEESYDRIIRDEQHLWNVVQYIGRNPGKAGLPRDQWHRWVDPSWVKAGWTFVDDLR